MSTTLRPAALIRRVWRWRPRPSWPAAGVLAGVLALEVVGRQSTSDFFDVGALAALVVLAAIGYSSRGAAAFLWARPLLEPFLALYERARAAVRYHRFEVGIDLRGRPALPAASPPLLTEALCVLGLVACTLLVLALGFPFDARSAAIRVLYVGFLASVVVLWCALLLVICTCVLLPAACIHDAFSTRHAGPTPRSVRAEAACVAGYFAAILVAGVVLPLWVASALVAAAVALFGATLWYRAAPTIALLWRQRRSPRVWSLDWRAYELQCVGAFTLILLVVVLAAAGRPALGCAPNPASTAPFTAFLGSVAAWLGAVALAAGAVFASRWLLTQRRRDPARPCPPSVHVRGPSPAAERGAALLQRRGWSVRFAPHPAGPADVQLELTDGPMPALGGQPTWPLVVSVKGLELPELQQVLARRDQIQRRRLLLRGFEKLFKRAAARSFKRGTGFWIAPHYWFIAGMTRDTDEEDYDPTGGTVVSGVIGPAYHVLMPRAARQHAHEVLRAADVDLIFVEDGVGFRGFREVLRVLFEHYDVHGTCQPILDRHFLGLPRTRVILHEYELGQPLRRNAYPEPDYDTIGRARILHVFRDRGDHEEPVADPVDRRGLPVPLLQ